MKLEDEVTAEVLMEASKNNVTLMRNNCGAFTDASGRPIRFGLGNLSAKQSADFKSSDYIGVTSIVITPSMIGKTVGIFTAIEMKKEGWGPKNLDKREQGQLNFIEFIKARGAIAGFANSIESFKVIISDFKTWLVG